MFRFYSGANSAPLFERQGGIWEPQAHFTGVSTDPYEIRAVQNVIDCHMRSLVAYHLYCPLPGTYSLELQWDREGRACSAIRDYEALFDDESNLIVKPELGKLAIAVKPAITPAIIGLKKGELEAWVGTVELLPYPGQYRRKGLSVCVCENGIYRPFAYNRWGIVGDFLVRRFNADGKWLNLTERQVDEIMTDLSDAEGGYLSDACPTLCPFREPFKKYGVPPSGALPEAGRWFN
jgi:hypothetical protein